MIQMTFWMWLNIKEHANYQNNYQEANGKDSFVSVDVTMDSPGGVGQTHDVHGTYSMCDESMLS